MAEAIFSGFIKKQKLTPDQISVTNRQNTKRLLELKERYGINTYSNHEIVLQDADVVILAMKPTSVTQALASIRPFTSENQLFISVLAGITTEYISYILGHNAPVIRVMPNTSAAVGSSTTVIAAGDHANEKQLKLTESLFQSIGIVKLVKEIDMDSITAIAGSGPAFIYYLVEAMTDSLEELELDPQLGEELILQMIQGSVDLLKTTNLPPRELYEQVKSPGGTTEAGLHVLANHDVQRSIMNCLEKAANRSKQISKEMSTIPEDTIR
ncbi:pyrroline-5-carboxylate reductase [Halalkalibacter akibai]|uniref:Pyrroline-5-carboxylate reductase n=1 Tax=Halalkalibacter akibai (strain ATCC 43226 / DSM 21942 / CIP 109018 / JCM 9157 / 1139) TaxID=1236973 RepID=W4QTW8_HALA3|nr:pyrroline-5-carboxylate reductase [Halalkalibacter akibai]GAE35516.1 pyrroline-5-carboxylate reductase [Halalkalibacter akibai JCM 9157]